MLKYYENIVDEFETARQMAIFMKSVFSKEKLPD